MLLSSLAEIASLSAIVPFIGILISPQDFLTTRWGSLIGSALGVTSHSELVVPLSITFAILALLAGGTRIFLIWSSSRLACVCGSDLSSEVYRRTLLQPYQVHISRNSSEVISSIISKVDQVSYNVLVPLLTLMSSVVLGLTISLTLFVIDPKVALASVLVFGTCYTIVLWFTRSKLRANSHLIALEQGRVIKALQEGLGGIRDVLLDGTQATYCDIYRKSDYPLRTSQGNNIFISQSPRYAIEALGVVFLVVFTSILSQQRGGLGGALPVLGALALGAQRLLPAMQQGFGAWATIAGNYASLFDVLKMLNQPVEAPQLGNEPLPFERELQLRDVRFTYQASSVPVLNGVNLAIRKGSRIGFVGSTGSGKSTLLDLIMGLLRPTEGAILVDQRPLGKNNLVTWQKMISHVPQSIFLADASLAENIAFGVPLDDIDMDRVREVARQAKVSEFVEQMPEKYLSNVGERGVRLSGGQRQRIGIARALYKNAKVLIFDEATSALDNVTEKQVMETIQELDRDLTILMIAHRLSSLKECDTIIEIERGTIVGQGNYNELLLSSESFKSMAQPS